MTQEDLLFYWLREVFPGKKIVREYTFSNNLRLDFYIPKINLAIEYQGIQHFKYVDHFYKSKTEFHMAQNRDEQKVYICDQLGIQMIFFDYRDKLTKKLVEERYKEVGNGNGVVQKGAEKWLNRRVVTKLHQRGVRKIARDAYKKSDAYAEKLKAAKEWRKKKYRELKSVSKKPA
jgi:hypothetical protein